MPPVQPSPPLAGSFRMFTFAGVTAYVHWSWLVIAWLELQFRTSFYELWVWNVAEYVAFFGIVLLHEYGHALACKQVGGQADQVVIWPLGGFALVNPPPRPGPCLWSYAAGPLVNLVLVPFSVLVCVFAGIQGLGQADADAQRFLFTLTILNIIVLALNMLPIYPLDGGMIAQALLWFVMGRATSLLVVSIVGIFAAAAVIAAAIFFQEWWFIVLAVFTGFRCVSGITQARALARLENLPRHQDATCPSCAAHPIAGPFWACDECQAQFDTFEHEAECPRCRKQFPRTSCPECGRAHPIWAWYDGDGEW